MYNILFPSTFVYLRAKRELRGSGYYVAIVLHMACFPSALYPLDSLYIQRRMTRKVVAESGKETENTGDSKNVAG
jgi:hypothetical protein